MTPARLAAAALAAAVLVIAFAAAQEAAARYKIPSGSMKPTLLPGSVLTANQVRARHRAGARRHRGVSARLGAADHLPRVGFVPIGDVVGYVEP